MNFKTGVKNEWSECTMRYKENICSCCKPMQRIREKMKHPPLSSTSNSQLSLKEIMKRSLRNKRENIEDGSSDWPEVAKGTAKGQWNQTGRYTDSMRFRMRCSVDAEKAMAPYSKTLAWRILWTEEPGRLQSMGSLRVGHNSVTSLLPFTFMHWRRKWQPTPVFLPGESQGRGSLVGCLLWGRTELDTTEVT